MCWVYLYQVLYKHLPRQRKLPDQLKKEAVSLLDMNANKKVVQQKMATKSGNIVLLKDLSNIRTAALTSNSRNDLDGTIKSLMDKYGNYSEWQYA